MATDPVIFVMRRFCFAELNSLRKLACYLIHFTEHWRRTSEG